MSTYAPITPTQEEQQQPESIAVPTVRTFMHRIGFCITCVIPADMLSLEAVDAEDASDLYTDASQNELSYVRVFRMLEEGLYLARVACSPERVTHGYTVILTEEQLSYALPWDIRLSSLKRFSDGLPDAQRLLKAMCAHRAALRPTVRYTSQVALVETPKQEEEALTALPPVFISERNMKKALGPHPENALHTNTHRGVSLWGRMRTWLTIKLLQAALKATIHCRVLHDAISQVLTGMQNTTQPLVSAREALEEGQHVGWWVIVGTPQPLAI